MTDGILAIDKGASKMDKVIESMALQYNGNYIRLSPVRQEFNSPLGRLNGFIAQLAERHAVNVDVEGSSPSIPAGVRKHPTPKVPQDLEIPFQVVCIG